MATKLNVLTDTPKKKSEITQAYMVDYIKYKGTDEDKAWFKALANANKKVVEKGVAKGKPVLDIKPVRAAFCERFFPNLNTKKDNKRTIWDDIDEL